MAGRGKRNEEEVLRKILDVEQSIEASATRFTFHLLLCLLGGEDKVNTVGGENVESGWRSH